MNVLILTSVLGIVAMVSEIFGFKKSIWYLVIAALAGIFFVNLQDWDTARRYYDDMVFIDNYAIAFMGLLLFLAILWVFLSKDQYESEEFNISDHYAQIIFSLTGALVLVSYSNLSMLFLGVEIMSIPLYILAGSRKKDLASNEAALKYFMMGAFATGFLLFGITLIYGVTGSFNLGLIQQYTTDHVDGLPVMFYAGVVMIMVGLGFKVSAFPFHFWAPDVYEGAPILISAFMATIVKTAAFGGFYRLFSVCFTDVSGHWAGSLSIVIAATILVGNVMAVYQVNMKRMLAYSGIAQAGYLLLTLLILNNNSANALIFYVGSYAIATLCAFGGLYWVIKLKGNDGLESFNGLAKSNPVLSFVMTVSMLSLAGIPPAAGFFAKFYLFTVLMENGYLMLVVLAVVGSLISVYYYFKIIIRMYGNAEETISLPISFYNKAILVMIVVAILALGVMPDFFLGIITQ